jgi:hypothetical protein
MTASLGLFATHGALGTGLDHADWRIYFYIIAQLIGGSGLTLLLATMLWPTKKRK